MDSHAKTDEWARIAMGIRRVGIVLLLALPITSGCRSTSVARREAASSGQIASHTKPTNGHRESKADSVASATMADTDSDIQQVSNEVASDEKVKPANQLTATRLSVHDAIETALTQNPDLIALREAEGVGTAALGLAQTYPFNPFLQVQATPYQEALDGRSGSTYHYILLMQQIELAHQQHHREAAGCAALNGIRWNILQAELLNVAQTERLYFAALFQQGLLELANFNAENNRQMYEILQSQYEAGQATAADVAIVRLDARSTDQQQKVAEANVQTALLDLKRHLGLLPEANFSLDKEFLRWNWKPIEVRTMTEIAAGRPDVMAARADADVSRANTNLADAARIPDLQIGPYYQRDFAGATFLGFRGQIDLPVINSGVPLLRQRQAELHKFAVTAQQLATRARLEAEAAVDRYERARQIVVDSDIPSHETLPIEFERLEELFKVGEVDVLRVLQARNSLIQSERADLDALNELMLSAVAITATTGAPLESLAAPSVPSPAGAAAD